MSLSNLNPVSGAATTASLTRPAPASTLVSILVRPALAPTLAPTLTQPALALAPTLAPTLALAPTLTQPALAPTSVRSALVSSLIQSVLAPSPISTLTQSALAPSLARPSLAPSLDRPTLAQSALSPSLTATTYSPLPESESVYLHQSASAPSSFPIYGENMEHSSTTLIPFAENQVNENVNELTENSPKALISKKIKIRLFDHQRTNVFEMERRECERVLIFNSSLGVVELDTNIGILGDPPGLGKTLQILSLIANNRLTTIPFRPINFASSSENACFKINCNNSYTELIWTNISLIVIPPKLKAHWIKEISEKTTLSYYLVKKNAMVPSNNVDIVLLPSSKWLDFMFKWKDVLWLRIIFDEADSIASISFNISKKQRAEKAESGLVVKAKRSRNFTNSGPIGDLIYQARFEWYVTATYDKFYDIFAQEEAGGRGSAYGVKKNFIFAKIRKIMKLHCDLPILSKLVVKGNQDYLDMSCRLGNYKTLRINCITPFYIRAMKGLMSKKYMEKLYSQSLDDENPLTTCRNYLETKIRYYQGLQNTAASSKKIKGKEEKVISHAEKKKIYEDKLTLFNFRIRESEGKCIICSTSARSPVDKLELESNKSEVLLLEQNSETLSMACCSSPEVPRFICKICISSWFEQFPLNYDIMNEETRAKYSIIFNCPHCGIKISPVDLAAYQTWISEHLAHPEPKSLVPMHLMLESLKILKSAQVDTYEKNVPCSFQLFPSDVITSIERYILGNNYRRKTLTCFNIILSHKGRKKFLVYSNSNFYLLMGLLNAYGIPCAELKGLGYQKIMEEFKYGTIQILLLNATFSGAGLDFSSTDGIIILHKLSPSIEKQVIGRGNRIGRDFVNKPPLEVYYVCYETEY